MFGPDNSKFVDGVPNPYKQFTFTIANGAIETLFYSFNFFRILTLVSGTGVTVRFGSSGTPTDVIGAGIGYRLPGIVDRAQIINNSGGPITITVAVCVGEIMDDRLSVSGAISIVNTPTTALYALTPNENLTDGPLTVGVGATVPIVTASGDQSMVVIKNTGAWDIYIGTSNVPATLITNGFLLKPGDVFAFDGEYGLMQAIAQFGSSLLRVMQFKKV